MKKISALILSLVLIFSLGGCTKEEETISMGFVPMKDGDQLIESVEPLTDMLSEKLGVKVEGFTATNYVGVVEGLGSGQVDFGFIPPFAYVLANSENNSDVILTALNKDGEANYRSQFLVRKDSGIEEIKDAKGKKIAFVDPSSTSGYLFPGAHLIREGIDIENDMEYVYAGGHDKALQLLLNKDVEMATTFVDSRERYKEDFPTALEELDVIEYTDYIPNISVTVRDGLDQEMSEKISQALIEISESEEGKELLKELFNMYGFVAAEDGDYDIIRKTAETMNVDLKEQE